MKIPLSHNLMPTLMVYLPQTPPDIAGVARASLKALEEPLRGLAQRFAQMGMLQIATVPASSVPTPNWRLLELFGALPADMERMKQATAVTLVRCTEIPAPPRAATWAVIAVAEALADAGGGIVYDPTTPRVGARRPRPIPAHGEISVLDHVLLPTSLDPEGQLWITTQGMGRLGLPNLELRAVPPHLGGPAEALVVGVAQALFERANLAGAQAMQGEAPLPPELDLPDGLVVEPAHIVRAGSSRVVAQAATIPLRYPGVGRDRGGAFVTVGPEDADVGAWLHTIFTAMFPAGTELFELQTDTALEDAHQQAIAELPQIKERFLAGLEQGARLFVKYGFPTGQGLRREFMWVGVSSWDADILIGDVTTQPREVPNLQAGQTVGVHEAGVFDWLIVHPDGRTEGAYTSQGLG